MEAMIALGLSSAIILLSSGLLSKNQKAIKSLGQASDEIVLRSAIQRRLIKEDGVNTRCKTFFSDINFNNYALITESSPVNINVNKISTILKIPIIFGLYKISAVRLFGKDPGGLTEISSNGNETTLQGELSLTLTKPSETKNLDPIEVIFTINTATGIATMLNCAPTLYEQKVSFEICRTLGNDFIIDPLASGQCLVPVYNCCDEADPAFITCSKNLIIDNSERAPCDYKKLTDVLCDLQERSMVPGQTFCN